ncbi:MAG TPA: ClpX C4-type zinc finger protein [Terriglobia bacterium]|nr:ClpX C4-type zinc finger protein [Terriglobia bacterium]
MPEWTCGNCQRTVLSKCSFCGKDRSQINLLIASGCDASPLHAFICNECVGVCREIVEDPKRRWGEVSRPQSIN